MIVSAARQDAGRWFVRPRPNSLARLRLFCLPAAGSSASAFFEWSRLLPPEIELCSVQLPGRQQRSGEPPYRRTALAVCALEQAMRPYLDMPFAIFGTCTGSLLAYDVAQRLRGRGFAPAALLASCCRAPHLPDRDAPIHALPEGQLWTEVTRLGGTSPLVLASAEMRAMLLATLRADFELAETYSHVPAPPLDCPLRIFGGRDDEIVSRDELDAWQVHANGRFDVVIVPGGHYLLDTAATELTDSIAELLLAEIR